MTATIGTILMTEDDSTDVLLLRRAFRKAGVTNPLQVVSDGEKAVAYLAGAGAYADRDRYPLPSLLLLDINLPRLSGFDVLTWMRQQPDLRGLRVVMLTSSVQPADVSRAYDAGANGYHVKPVGFPALLQLVEALKSYWLTWAESPAGLPTRSASRPEQALFSPVTDLTDAGLAAKSKAYALLSRHPAGLTAEELADEFLSRGLASGDRAALARGLEDILTELEQGPAHRRVTRVESRRYRAVPFW
jgi:CheY-like chemotaxis protein